MKISGSIILSKEEICGLSLGSPRVIGALHFKSVAQRWLGAKLYSNGSDLVTRLPPPSLDSGVLQSSSTSEIKELCWEVLRLKDITISTATLPTFKNSQTIYYKAGSKAI